MKSLEIILNTAIRPVLISKLIARLAYPLRLYSGVHIKPFKLHTASVVGSVMALALRSIHIIDLFLSGGYEF